ncbi:uncharacterized protein C6G9.01c-like [Humulus lupulus]|uniref:uncharacterized protein C6G9.01c-like n=1 Tax=Humulus lupulus TaxID=3486 RepID=UPI002B4061BF|nr:uncharacterized protein C6G9.01c-like [Humulus lupulus]
MGKKTKSKTTSSPQEKEKDVKQLENKPSSKKPTTEIDEIFATKKRKKLDQEKTQKPAKDGGAKKKEKKRTRRKEDDDKSGGFWESDSRPRKKTQDGIAVYTEEELGLNNSDAGGTRLCPFDCSCCF